nr:hypothetical protein [Tanacetum cinerariifolium]
MMSTTVFVDPEISTYADRAQSFRVPVPLPYDPYVAFRQAWTDSSHSPASSNFTAPLSGDHPLTHVSPTPTPTYASFHSRTVRMTVHAQPVMSPGHSARVAEAMALSDLVFCKRYRSSYETPSSSLSLAFQVRKRYRDDEGHGLDDEGRSVESDGLGLESEDEVVREGQQRVTSVVETTVGKPIGLGYGALRNQELAVEEDHVYSTFETPSSPEWSSGSLPISPAPSVVLSPIPSPMISLIFPSPIALPMATLTATILVDEDQFIEVWAQLELHKSILHDHTQRLDAMPPTLFTELELERTTVTYEALWRPVLALEAWAGHVDTRMVDFSRAGYGDHRLIHEMLVQQVTLQRDLQEMRGYVTALEQERGRRERNYGRGRLRRTLLCCVSSRSLLLEPLRDRWTDSPMTYRHLGPPKEGLYPKGPIAGMTLAQALTAIQTMADHSQKWHDNSSDLGSSISIMPFLMFKHLGIGELETIDMIVELADKTKYIPKRIVKNMLIKINKFILPVDFVILDILEDFRMPINLGKPLLVTAYAKVDVFRKSIS